ncbi:hypothetical protein ACJJTC_001604 [Scirpophaga incertulas]
MATLGLSKVFILDKYFTELQKFWETEKKLQGERPLSLPCPRSSRAAARPLNTIKVNVSALIQVPIKLTWVLVVAGITSIPEETSRTSHCKNSIEPCHVIAFDQCVHTGVLRRNSLSGDVLRHGYCLISYSFGYFVPGCA